MDRSKQTKPQGAPPKRQEALNETLKALMVANLLENQIDTGASGASAGDIVGHYEVLQIFDAKWAHKSMGPSNHVAWRGWMSLGELKEWAASNLMEYPTVAIHIRNIDDVNQPTHCYNADDGWIERPVRRGWF